MGHMKIGVVPLNVGLSDPEHVRDLAVKSEEVGAESIWTFEHVIVPENYASKYPYHASGRMPAAPETPFIDPLIALAHAAAVTRRIRLATGVNILPQANPLFLAKQVASLDFLCGGRLSLGVGIGWLKEEFDALGVPFERRGARFADYMRAMKKVWSGEAVEHKSEFLDWSGFKSYPLPTQKPHPPIVVGGTSKKALERVVEFGDGWLVPTPVGDLGRLSELLAQLKHTAQEAGRDPESIEISSTWDFSREGVDSVAQYRDLGVSRLVVGTFQLGDAPMPGLDKLGNAMAKLA